MLLENFIITAYCLIDKTLQNLLVFPVLLSSTNQKKRKRELVYFFISVWYEINKI